MDLDACLLGLFDLPLALYNRLLHRLLDRIPWGSLGGLHRDGDIGGVDVNGKPLEPWSIAHELLAVDDLLQLIGFGGMDRTLVESTAYLGILLCMLVTTILLDLGDRLDHQIASGITILIYGILGII
jgi:hypothetical protein